MDFKEFLKIYLKTSWFVMKTFALIGFEVVGLLALVIMAFFLVASGMVAIAEKLTFIQYFEKFLFFIKEMFKTHEFAILTVAATYQILSPNSTWNCSTERLCKTSSEAIEEDEGENKTC